MESAHQIAHWKMKLLLMKIHPTHHHRILLHLALTNGQNVPQSLYLIMGAMIQWFERDAKNRATPVKTKQRPTLNQHNAKHYLARGVGKIHHAFFHSDTKRKRTTHVQRRMIQSIGALQQRLFHGLNLDIAMRIVQ